MFNHLRKCKVGSKSQVVRIVMIAQKVRCSPQCRSWPNPYFHRKLAVRRIQHRNEDQQSVLRIEDRLPEPCER